MTVIKQALKEAARFPVESLLKIYLDRLPSVEFSPEKIGKILIFAYHGLGNFLMYTPAIKALRERYPNARIDLQVGNNTGCEEVLAGAGLFDNIYNLPYSSGPRAWAERAREIRAIRYDLTLNEFHSHSWRLALLVSASRAPFRAGHVTSPGWSRRFSRYSFVFNLPVSMREDEHEVERYLDLVAATGAKPPGLENSRTFIHLTGAEREFARSFFEPWIASGKRSIIGIQPGTSPAMRWKQWPVERYRALIERLALDRPDALIVLFGSAGEAGMIADLARGLESKVAVAAGKTSIKQVAALIESCDMLICNDSGLMHVAVAVQTPVIAIYGPTDIRRTAPLGPQHSVIRRDLPCSPCFRLEGDEEVHLCPHHDCLMTVEPDEVLQAALKSSLVRLEMKANRSNLTSRINR
ncbi:MAG TPA: lipopolysaccharide heptosyltransferase II [Blastocatellia bacterium]|jgi:lipopolysaccharide heptosyltransferase II|nr:lipopolysaccharide heptosyltransferase II [Blastocatellia bacterium]